MKQSPHGPTISFWGGALDGTEYEAIVESRLLEPPEWHRGYRRYEVARHGKDNSVCYVVYIWREVWPE